MPSFIYTFNAYTPNIDCSPVCLHGHYTNLQPISTMCLYMVHNMLHIYIYISVCLHDLVTTGTIAPAGGGGGNCGGWGPAFALISADLAAASLLDFCRSLSADLAAESTLVTAGASRAAGAAAADAAAAGAAAAGAAAAGAAFAGTCAVLLLLLPAAAASGTVVAAAAAAAAGWSGGGIGGAAAQPAKPFAHAFMVSPCRFHHSLRFTPLDLLGFLSWVMQTMLIKLNKLNSVKQF